MIENADDPTTKDQLWIAYLQGWQDSILQLNDHSPQSRNPLKHFDRFLKKSGLKDDSESH